MAHVNDYIYEPKCMVCNEVIDTEWLANDYSILICKRKKCWKIFWKKNLDEQMAMNDESQNLQRKG